MLDMSETVNQNDWCKLKEGKKAIHPWIGLTSQQDNIGAPKKTNKEAWLCQMIALEPGATHNEARLLMDMRWIYLANKLPKELSKNKKKKKRKARSEIKSISSPINDIIFFLWWTWDTTHWMPVSTSHYYLLSKKPSITSQKADSQNSWRNVCKASTADSNLWESRRQVEAISTICIDHICTGSVVVIHFPTHVCRWAKTVASDQRWWFKWNWRSSHCDPRHTMQKGSASLHRMH
jgi:hypothetical protein